jgi:hypothetical protein
VDGTITYVTLGPGGELPVAIAPGDAFKFSFTFDRDLLDDRKLAISGGGVEVNGHFFGIDIEVWNHSPAVGTIAEPDQNMLYISHSPAFLSDGNFYYLELLNNGPGPFLATTSFPDGLPDSLPSPQPFDTAFFYYGVKCCFNDGGGTDYRFGGDVTAVNGPWTTASVPEPDSAALLMSGILGLGFASRIRPRRCELMR